jgi:hypothetical protein
MQLLEWMFTYRFPAIRFATSVGVIPVHIALMGLAGLLNGKTIGPETPGAPAWIWAANGLITSCVHMILSDVWDPSSVALHEPVAVLPVPPACVPSSEAAKFIGAPEGGVLVGGGGPDGGVAVAVGVLLAGGSVGLGTHAPLSPAPMRPFPLVSAASMHVVKSGHVVPLHFVVGLIAHLAMPLAFVVMHGATGGVVTVPHVERE